MNDDFEIFPAYEAFYITSMLYLADSVVTSSNWISDFFEANAKVIHKADPYPTLNQLQNIVIQSAALSRYFWPTRKGFEARANKLRRSLAITDASPLRSRDLRNQMEHFDEYLDDHLKNGIVGQIVPHYLGKSPGDNNGVSLHFFRAYFTDIGVFEILGKRYEIQPIIDEVVRIHDLLQKYDEEGSRLP